MEPYDVIVNQPVVIDNVSNYHNKYLIIVFNLISVNCILLQKTLFILGFWSH